MTRPHRAKLPQAYATALAASLILVALSTAPCCAQVAEATSEAASAAVPGQTASSAPGLPPGNIKASPPIGLLTTGGWNSLTVTQRGALAPLEHDWDKLDSSRRSKWLEVAARFHTLPADEQARLRDRMSEWAKLSPNERQQARVGFQSTQQIKSGDLQAKWEAYQALPAERRQALADRAALKTQPPNIVPSTKGPAAEALAKSNLVPAPINAPITAVAPSMLQAKPGASTVLITQGKTLPAHQLAGQPKVLADPSLVDPKTLLPKVRVN